MGVVRMSDPIDDRIRDRMRDSYPLDHGSSSVLDELRPQMTRARSRRKAVQASVGAAGLGALLIGALLLAPRLSQGDPSELELAGPTESSVADDDGGPESTTSELGRTVEEPASSVVEDTTSLAPVTSAEPPTTTPSSAADPTTATPSTTIESSSTSDGVTTTAASPSTTEAETTTTTSESSSSTNASQVSTVTTACGTLRVELVGSGIELVSTAPTGGVSVDVKDSGPETVEVRFRSDDRDCEVHAENRGGQLWTDIENDVDDEDEDD